MKNPSEMTEPELREVMNRCGRSLRSILGTKSKFVLLWFDDPAVGQYLSTCDRKTMVEALRETAERIEKNQDVPR